MKRFALVYRNSPGFKEKDEYRTNHQFFPETSPDINEAALFRKKKEAEEVRDEWSWLDQSHETCEVIEIELVVRIIE